MNFSASPCGSGCESGWTLYLDQSSFSETQGQSFFGIADEDYGGKGVRLEQEDKEEEEDLSMVSDASSGPRHYREDDEDCRSENGRFYSVPSKSAPAMKTKRKTTTKEYGGKQQYSCIDDTASSPMLSFSRKTFKKEAPIDVLDFSQGFSVTHFKGGESDFKKKLGLLQSSFGPKEAGGYHGRNWE